MNEATTANRQMLANKVKESTAYVERQAVQLRTQYTRLIVLGTVTSGGSTMVAAVTAALGPIIGKGIEGWRLACIVAAILGFIATLCISLSQQLGVNERLSEANKSLGRLKSLDLAIATGTREWGDITTEYQDIIQSYPDALR